jgi:hypothetical protein
MAQKYLTKEDNITPKIQEMLDKHMSSVDSKLEKVMEAVETKLENTVDSVIEGFKNTPMIKGEPGKSVNEDEVIKKITAKLPKDADIAQAVLKKIPRVNEDAIAKRVLSKIPKQKGMLKVVQEKAEIDPMAVIEKILALPEDRFKLKTKNIDGLEQTISSFHSQLGKGYLHGSGLSAITDLIQPGTNVTLDGSGTQSDPYIINASGGGGGGNVSSVFGRTGSVSAQTGDYTTDLVTEGTNLYFTDERAQDAVGGILLDSTTIDLTYNDSTPSITASVIAQMSITSDASGIKLSGDSSTPGNSKYYGTDSGGTKGYFTLPTSSTGTVTSVTGTANRITITGVSTVNPTVDIAATYVGQSSITTLGTITTGIWNGTDIAVTDGGTGSSTASGARTNLGLVIGTDVQAFNAGLLQIAGLGDPNADRLMFWDDSASSYAYLTLGTGLSITGTTINAAGAVTSVSANDTTLTISPTTGAVLAVVNQANNFAWTGASTYSASQTFNGAVSFTSTATFTNLPTSSATVTTSNQLVNKQYVDVFAQGLKYKGSVTAATTTTLPANTYNNGASGVGATLTGNANGALSAQDGVTLTVNQLLLVKNEAAPANNGIYTLTQVGTGGTPYILTRTTNFDQAAEILQGSFVSVLMGTVQGNTVWAMYSSDVTTVGTDPVSFSQLSAPTVYTATLGVKLVGNDFEADLDANGALTLSGNSLQVAVDNSSIEISSNALRIKALGVTNGMLAGSIADSKLSQITTAAKVSGAAITLLTSLPSGAGLIPQANLGSGSAGAGAKVLFDDQTYKTLAGAPGVGDVTGPGSSLDFQIPVWDGTTGTVLKNSGLKIVDDGIFTFTGLISIDKNFIIAAADDKAAFIQGGNGATTNAGPVGILGGSGGVGTDFNGGGVFISGGSGGYFDSGTGGNSNGGAVNISGGGGGDTSGNGADVIIVGGEGLAAASSGGNISISAGNGANTGGQVIITAASSGSDFGAQIGIQTGGSGIGGDIVLAPGQGFTTDGRVFFVNPTTSIVAAFDVSQLSGGQKDIVIPNASGTLAVSASGNIALNSTTGNITFTGTLPIASGGTGITSYTVGDLIYASGTTTLSKLADVATGNVLRSGGVGVAPAYGKVVLTTDVSGVLPAANMTQVDVQVFTTSSTWNKPTGAKYVHIKMIGGGGGGGSGRKDAAATTRWGGGGGGGGGWGVIEFSAALLGATETVTVGGGGAGGASVSANTTNGNSGTRGDRSSFGNWLSVAGGLGGAGGANISTTTISGGNGFPNESTQTQGGTGGGFSTSGAAPGATNQTTMAGAGGGAGGGITTANVASAGATGGISGGATTSILSGYAGTFAGGTGGAINTNGSNGTAATTNSAIGGGGGGGGGSSTTTNGGSGGNGAVYGSGGGGGGAATNGVGNSGAGGTGGSGIVIVTTYF